MEGVGLGASAAIFDESGRVLLVLREDYEVWGLPGGVVDPGESPAAAAIREVFEETGLRVRLDRLVGMYYVPEMTQMGLNAHSVCFTGTPIDGTLTRSRESLDVRYFPVDALPDTMLGWHRRRIHDAARGAAGLVVRQHMRLKPYDGRIPTSRAELYAAIAAQVAQGKSKQELFAESGGAGATEDIVELGDT